MKKTASILITFLAITFHAIGQSTEPQLWFYSNTAPVLGDNANDVEESNTLSLQIKYNNWLGFSNEQILNMYYRIYEIQNTSEIFYSPIGIYDDGLPFISESAPEVGYIHVDFGSNLIGNENYFGNYNGEYSHRLRFASPIHKIDPELFSFWVDRIKLPPIEDLSYSSSPDIFTTNLVMLEGYDVYNYTSLINKDSTLIVAATSAKPYYIIPEFVKSIGAGALRGTLLHSLIIPSNVSSIGDQAFDLSDIQSYYILSTNVPTLGENVFYLRDKKTTIYVPKKALRSYKKAWKPLKKHIKAIPKSFDPDMSVELFNPNRIYKIQSGLALKGGNCVYNKNNRFLNTDFSMELNRFDVAIWNHLTKYGASTDINLMTNVIYGQFDEFSRWEDAKEYITKTLEKWFHNGVIARVYDPF